VILNDMFENDKEYKFNILLIFMVEIILGEITLGNKPHNLSETPKNPKERAKLLYETISLTEDMNPELEVFRVVEIMKDSGEFKVTDSQGNLFSLMRGIFNPNGKQMVNYEVRTKN